MATQYQLIRYLRACYKAKNCETSIWNLFHDKIEKLLGPSNCVLRGGRRGYLHELKLNLQAILHGVTGVEDGDGDPRTIERNLRGVDQEIARLETQLRNRNAREQA